MVRCYKNKGALHGLKSSRRVLRAGTWVDSSHFRQGDVVALSDVEAKRIAYKLEEVSPASLPSDPDGSQEIGPPGGEAPVEAREVENDPPPEPKVEEPSPGIGGALEPAAKAKQSKPEAITPARTAHHLGNPALVRATKEEAPPPPEKEPATQEDMEPYSTGHGWYTLPGGERVQGWAAACDRLKEIMRGAD